ncbi:MAG: HAD-IIIC family phosphatase [Clostridiales bacterium]|jgi:FkbH-like protein|nr:HAD-IIIC family phosphatase [Eubacteriales bacterium]MDH7567672.1 HAD-IIIC family phosphatase [Clostridiales bacterium]
MMNSINIALLGNSTTDYIASSLSEECKRHGISASIYNSPFNQYQQEVLNPVSGFYASAPELALLLLEGRLLFPEWYDFTFLRSDDKEKASEIQTVFDSIVSVVEKIHQNSGTKILVNNFKIPYHTPLGILDNKSGMGLKQMIAHLNQKLEEFASDKEYVYIFDYNGLSSHFGHIRAESRKMYYITKSLTSFSFSKLLAKEYMRYILPLKSKTKKCLVLDLDNTLWGGVAGEDGLSGIKLDISGAGRAFYDFQQEIVSLHSKGIILAVNSKNNYEDAVNIIENHPHMLLRKKYFSCLKINWQNKADNLKEIANELNIGVDSLVFFDDSPVEREFVKTALPQVTVVEVPEDASKYAEALRELVEFESLSITEEDINRNKMYEESRKRNEILQHSKDLEEFLKNLESKVVIEYANPFNIPRIAQLTQKTNQFNMTTKRYLVEDIENMAGSGEYKVFSCSVSDKFGDNGIVGVCIVKTEAPKAFIDTFLLSCRVLGRNVEFAFLSGIVGILRENGFDSITALYIRTEKNKANQDFYSQAGFMKINEKDGMVSYILNSRDKLKEFKHIDVSIKKEE